MRLVLNTVILVISVVVTATVGVLAFPFVRGGRAGACITRAWARSLLFVSGVRLDVEGARGLGKGPFLITPNHASMLDIMVCSAALPLRFHFVSRPFFFKLPILGWGMRALGHLSLDPKKPREAARALRGFSARFARSLSVALFPEGTRSPDGTLATYKRGPFLTAIQNQIPVLPVRHFGTHVLFPKGSLALRPGTVRVVVGEPIPTAGLGPPDARALAKRVEDWARGVS